LIFDSLRALEASRDADEPVPVVERGLRPQRHRAVEVLGYGSMGVIVLAAAFAGGLLMRGDGDAAARLEAALPPEPMAADGVADRGALASGTPSAPALAVQWPAPRAALAQHRAPAAPELPARSPQTVQDAAAAEGRKQAPQLRAVEAENGVSPGEPRTSGEGFTVDRADESSAGYVRAAASRGVSRRIVEALRTRLVLALEAGRYADAQAALEELTAQLGEDSRFARQMRAYYLYQTGDIDAAASAYDELLVDDPDDADMRMTTVRIAVQRGRYEEAARRLAALTSDPRYRGEALELAATLAPLLPE